MIGFQGRLRAVALAGLLGLFAAPLADASESSCFDGYTDPLVNSFLQPNRLCIKTEGKPCRYERVEMNESPETIREIHEMIAGAYRRYGLDPRLVYYRILGEAQGNPFQTPEVGAFGYGLFQMSSGLHGTGRHEKNIKALVAAHPSVSPRNLEVDYYINTYVEQMARYAKYGCRKHREFEQYSNVDKLLYLGLGNCDSAARAKEAQIFTQNKSYALGASETLSSLIDFRNPGFAPSRPLPLCRNY